MGVQLDRFLPSGGATDRRPARHLGARLAGAGLVGATLAILTGIGAVARFARECPTSGSGTPPGVLWGALVAALALPVLLLSAYRLARSELAARRDLDAAGEILKGLLGATDKGVILADPELRIRLLNPAAEMLFGRLADETLSLPVQTLIPDLRRPGQAGSELADDPARSRVRELRGRRGDEEFPLRLLLRDLVLDGEVWLLVLIEDQTESEQAEARLEYLEGHDLLTGLPNRRAFEHALTAGAADPELADTPHALCLIDLDHFKVVNDACGHAAGDKLLQQIAQILSTKLSDAACLARLGADELVALFSGEAAGRALGLCEEALRTVRSFLFTWEQRSFDVTASAGFVEYRPSGGTAPVLGHADLACQAAKARGGDRLHVYDANDEGSVRRRGDLELIPVIGSALDKGRFQVIAQPIRALQRADEALHYEILVRMRDDRGNLVVPEQFIPAAERYILMPAVDRWILSHVLTGQAARLRSWHAQHPERFLFAVNLSATTLMDDSFLPFLKRQFEEHRIPYPSLCFEVTETAAVSDLDRARRLMESLCELGCSFAVDDFGTGFSSYSYLKSLPVRYLKIDGSFVRNMDRDPMDKALVESINHIGHVLGLETIAEWAETPGLKDALQGMGVDYAQGYGVGQAIALEELDLHRVARTA